MVGTSDLHRFLCHGHWWALWARAPWNTLPGGNGHAWSHSSNHSLQDVGVAPNRPNRPAWSQKIQKDGRFEGFFTELLTAKCRQLSLSLRDNLASVESPPDHWRSWHPTWRMLSLPRISGRLIKAIKDQNPLKNGQQIERLAITAEMIEQQT